MTKPHPCPECHQPMQADPSEVNLWRCDDCQMALNPDEDKHCIRCQKPTEENPDPFCSPSCARDYREFKRKARLQTFARDYRGFKRKARLQTFALSGATYAEDHPN